MLPLDTKLNIILPSGLKKQRANFRKLAQQPLSRLVFDSRNVFPQSLDGLSGVEAFVNFVSAATLKWPFAVCRRDKAVFFASLGENITLATTCIKLKRLGASQRSVSLANIDMEAIFGAVRF